MAEITMPKMGDGMEEGTINAWLKREGDHISAGEPIAEVETDKANVEISAYVSGVLTKIVVQEGQTVPVGAVIAQIGGAESMNGAVTLEPRLESESSSNGAPSMTSSVPRAEVASELVSNGVGAPTTERVKASPLARRMMTELGIDAALVQGTGPGGRIVERDVRGFQGTRPARTPILPLPTIETTVESAPELEAVAAQGAGIIAGATTGQDMKPSNMRAAIARRTVLSKQSIPHFYVTMVVEMDRAAAMLRELNADATEGKVTVNDIIVKSCALALGKVPQVNSTWTAEGTVRQFSEANIGIAVGIDEGLIIPVVRNCETRTLRQISSEAKQLISKARVNQLKPEDYSGGTFSVSNLGMMGVDEFTAIINPPEAAILAIGGIFREPVVHGEGDQIHIRSRMKITISADHRLLDGVVAARFLQEVKKSLEAPFSLLS